MYGTTIDKEDIVQLVLRILYQNIEKDKWYGASTYFKSLYWKILGKQYY